MLVWYVVPHNASAAATLQAVAESLEYEAPLKTVKSCCAACHVKNCPATSHWPHCCCCCLHGHHQDLEARSPKLHPQAEHLFLLQMLVLLKLVLQKLQKSACHGRTNGSRRAKSQCKCAPKCAASGPVHQTGPNSIKQNQTHIINPSPLPRGASRCSQMMCSVCHEECKPARFGQSQM